MKRLPEISCSDMAFLINEWIPNQRDRRIMYRRMIDGVLFDDLADEFHLSVRRTKAIVYKWQEVIYRHCTLTK